MATTKNIDWKEASKTNWHTPVAVSEPDYPGNERMIIACLQRIADATDAMAQNYISLQDRLKYKERRVDELSDRLETEKKRTAALKGVVNRLKRNR